MSNYDNTNRGAIFKNDKKGNEKAPEYKGTINIEGTDYEIALWFQESKKDGTKFFSTSQKLKEARQPEPTAQPATSGADDDMGLPF